MNLNGAIGSVANRELNCSSTLIDDNLTRPWNEFPRLAWIHLELERAHRWHCTIIITTIKPDNPINAS